MINWNTLTSVVEVKKVVEQSAQQACVIFKHSTSCPISGFAKRRLEGDWQFGDDSIKPYYLDLLAYREVSNFVASEFGIDHESPQVLLIKDGICVYHTSHLDISVAELANRLV